MTIDIPRVSRIEVDRLVVTVPSPSLLYAADGTGGTSSSLQSLPTVATNEVAEISLLLVASLLQAVSQPTVATEIPAVSLPTVATDPNLQSATITTTSGSAETISNEGPRSFSKKLPY